MWNCWRWKLKVRKQFLILVSVLLLTGVGSATITSVDSITYNSNNEFFNGEVYAVSVASDQSTDKIDIFLDRDELSQQVDGEVNQDLEIDFTDQSTELRYSTSSSSELRPVYTFTPYHESGFTSKENAVDAIRASCFDLNDDGEGSGHWNAYYDGLSKEYEIRCFQEDTYLGTPAYIDNPDEIFTTEARLQASGKNLQTATLSNGDVGTGVVTDLGSHAKIRWNGNLDTGASTPDNTRVLGLSANRYDGSWRIVSDQAYRDYKSYLENQAHDTLQDWADGDNSGWAAAEWLNDRAWSAAEVDESSELAYTTVSDSSFRGGEFTYDTEDLLVYPMFTVYVDAGEDGYIEVTKPTGTPEITSTSSDDIEELGTGQISATVENVGNGEGSFSARVTECSSGFTSSDDQRTKTVPRGSSVSYSFDVSFQSTSRDQQEVGGSCTVEVQDTGSSASDSTSISVTGVQASECTAGEQSITVNEEGLYEIYECQSNEQGKELVKTCAEDEKAYAQGGSQFACEENKETGGGNNDGGGDGSGGGNGSMPQWIANLLEQLHLGFSLLGGLLIAAVGYKGGRWVDGEYQVKGSFQPFKSRSLDRVKRGRFLVGAIVGLASFGLGTMIVLQVPLFVQLVVILGVGFLLWKIPDLSLF